MDLIAIHVLLDVLELIIPICLVIASSISDILSVSCA
jgi:hypothetical protein